MFILKSTFWLGLAFIVIKPMDFDMKAQSEAIGQAAINASQKVIIHQLTTAPCKNLQCSGGKALTLASTFLSNNEQKPTSLDVASLTNIDSAKTIINGISAPKPQPRIKRNS